MRTVGNGDDWAVQDDHDDDGSVELGEEDHHIGEEGVSHRTLNDSVHKADTLHCSVRNTSRHRERRGRVPQQKITDRFQQIMTNHNVWQMSSERDLLRRPAKDG